MDLYPTPAPTLATIAAAVGCSSATVSRALRGSHLLPQSTILKIQRAAQKLGYQRNPLLGELMRRVRRTGRPAPHSTLAFLFFGPTRLAWRRHLTFVGFFDGAKARAEELGFRLEGFWGDAPDLKPARLTQILRARGITGLLVGPTPGLPRAPKLDWTHFSAVKIGVPFPDLALSCAHANQYRGALQVIERLRAQGRRRIGLVLEEHQHLKTAGMWVAPLLLHQAQIRPAERVPPLILRRWREKDFIPWLRAHRPDVVIGLRCELVTWLERAGLRVPADVGFVHLDRCTEAGDWAGLDQRPHEVGAAAMDLLTQLLLADERNLPPTPKHLLVESVWVPGPTLIERRTAANSSAVRASPRLGKKTSVTLEPRPPAGPPAANKRAKESRPRSGGVARPPT
ncbi:MAG: hypothetical protein RIQ93_1976 [Verrucomicrobiota bacterium]|jgi:DNA-binding LacI/PurR family transcriptional regulator